MPRQLPLISTMVSSTIIVRATDALPLAASVDDEQVSFLSSETEEVSPQ